MKQKYGLQLFSVRDFTEKDMAYTIEKVAQMGYSYLEFAGFYGHDANAIKTMMDANGVSCSGTHSGFEELRPSNITETIKFHKTIGNPNYIIPGADLSTLDKIKDFCNILNFAQPVLAAEGIRLGYHNHSHEFVVMPWGSTIHSELEKRTDVDFEIDTFWAFNAGVDPILTLDRLKDRIHVIHLKDGYRGGRGMSLGEGEAPIAAVRQKAIDMGLTIVVESETLTPDGLSEVKRCIDFLSTLEK